MKNGEVISASQGIILHTHPKDVPALPLDTIMSGTCGSPFAPHELMLLQTAFPALAGIPRIEDYAFHSKLKDADDLVRRANGLAHIGAVNYYLSIAESAV